MIWLRRGWRLGLVSAGVSWLACCGQDLARPAVMDDRRTAPSNIYAHWPDPLTSRERGSEQLAKLCARAGDDLIRSAFCADAPPSITSLIDLETTLHIDSRNLGGYSGLSIAAHSTGLGIRSVSTLNPRVIAVRLKPPPVEMLALAFTRGEQFVELIARDRVDRELRFYLLVFRQVCSDSMHGCTPGDLLTPDNERDWTEVSLYDESDVRNTVLDCAPCHQPAGPGTRKLLRMQELESPWTHWFFRSTEGGNALLDDYLAAKGDESLAGMSGAQIKSSQPTALNMLAAFGGDEDQPNAFDSQTIEAEVRDSAAALGGAQPADNSIPGQSATWRECYERSLRGEAIPAPYHDVKVTDPQKLARATDAYRAFRSGELASSELPDIRDIFPDDPQRLAEMGMMTEPELPGDAVLLQACAQCHNDRLDQALSRARFRADLRGLHRDEKERAIARLRLPESDPGAMPPARLRTLSEQARARAIEVLKR